MVLSFLSCAAAQEATAPTPDAKAASDAVVKLFTPNPVVNLPATHKPLPANGSWSAQLKITGDIPAACQSATMSCVRIFYRVPEVGVECSWTVGFVLDAAQKGDGSQRTVRLVIVDENENAALYTMKRLFHEVDASEHVIHTEKADYPPIARVASLHGGVTLRLIVGPDGKLQDMRVVAGPAMLQQPALYAANQWRFAPLTVGGQRTSFWTYVTFIFDVDATVSFNIAPNHTADEIVVSTLP